VQQLYEELVSFNEQTAFVDFIVLTGCELAEFFFDSVGALLELTKV
jgi:hypothetical protein